MEPTLLVAFLNGAISPEAFQRAIADEVTVCHLAFRSGQIGHIVISEGPSKLITREFARHLLYAVAEERLPFEIANYVADCIIMSDSFELADGDVRDAIFFVADESRHPTRDETFAALRLLD